MRPEAHVSGGRGLMQPLPDAVSIREVGPRDGLQNEPEVVATADKVALVECLARTGLRRLEVTSFVRADVIPQLADAADVLRKASIPEGVAVSVLVPNERGLEAALPLREHFSEVNLFVSATESHNHANVNRSVEESLEGLERVLARAVGEGLRCERVISVAFGCPYEGDVDPARVFDIAGPTPPRSGASSFESSFGELGGCPVPAGATGNVASEDLVSMLHEMGHGTGIDLPCLLDCARRAQELLGRPLGSHLLSAGPVDWRGA